MNKKITYVWVVGRGWDHDDCDTIDGVFSSEEKALEKIKNCTPIFYGKIDGDIIEWEEILPPFKKNYKLFRIKSDKDGSNRCYITKIVLDEDK